MSLGFTPFTAGAEIVGPVRVIDGDTLDVGGVRVRLFGIDAPEMAQTCDTPHGDWACGRWSRDVLENLTGGYATCVENGTDRYGRAIARCDAGHGDLGAAMVAAGAATAYRRYSDDYIGDENFARDDRRGIWRQNGSGVADPAVFRAARRAPRADTPQFSASGDGCVIKGNISAYGRIFHVPGQRDYDRTRITESRGERWFCSTEEALAAGWRAARR